MTFSKTFETDKGQIVILKKDSEDDDGEEIRVYFKPMGLGVCSIALGYPDGSLDVCDKYFESIDKKIALELIQPLVTLTEDDDSCVE